MAVITLTTDLGTKDHYVATIKGEIFRQYSDATIVDISHQISHFDISEAAFVVRNSYQHFPPGTIHIIGVQPDITNESAHVAIEFDKQFFIGADNGVFALIFQRIPDRIFELQISPGSSLATFPTRDVFAKAACHIARGGTLEMIGRQQNTIQQRTRFQPVVSENLIRGSVIYNDHYGNSITNISRTQFKEVGRGRAYQIQFRVGGYDLSKLVEGYQHVPEGERLALFNASGYLEISINQGSADSLLGLKKNEPVMVEFFDNR